MTWDQSEQEPHTRLHHDNDDDDDDDDDESYGDDDDEDDVSNDHHTSYDESDTEEASLADSIITGTWKDAIVWSAWRQHAVAILVAVMATILAAAYQQQAQANLGEENFYHSTSSSGSLRTGDDKMHPYFASTFRHEHLRGFQRTANVSFCSDRLHSQVQERLELMDFHVSRKFLDAMLVHYHADAMEDDDYTGVLEEGKIPAAGQVHNPEYHCLRQLAASTNKHFVKGMTYFYQPPSFVHMYPQLGGPDANDSNHEAANSTAAVIAGAPMNKPKKPAPAPLSFVGFAAKFINLSPHPVLLHWDGKGGHAKSARLVGEIAPFDSLGTATTPGQSFYVSPVYDGSHALDRWVLTADEAVMVYDPNKGDDTKLKSQTDRVLYHMQQLNLEFSKHYLIASHRTWLAHFPRPFPVHPMHRADFVGQATSIAVPHADYAVAADHRAMQHEQTLTLVVASVTPRVFTIENFLTADECQALIHAAQQQGLQGSTLYAGGMAQQQRDTSTRSSQNAWLARDTSALTDHIYRRAAHVLQMKERALQQPPYYYDRKDQDDQEKQQPQDPALSILDDPTRHSIAESLQVVRYRQGEEYTAHHDFVYPSLRHRYQPSRYATLLLYLNDDGLKGGETNFPRAVNPTNHEGISITPRQGRAVLFYNMLPDGNVDDLSQHQSLPVIQGEKWLANLWVWDPVIN